ncbi:MAG: GGDEF domain-containing protein [Deltaproteobacteria bacterium]|jgi:GAF domain-containing protein|nr:GGDEF domain-containing protein [Deltaproteobacteria bacterium]
MGNESNLDQGNPYSLWLQIEEILASQDPLENWVNLLPGTLLEWSGLSFAFLTEILHGDSTNLYIRGGAPELVGLKPSHPLEGGLAGWVHTHYQALAKDTLNTEDNLTHIFSPGEPIHRPTSFYGWPLIYRDQIMGGLILVGTKGERLNKELSRFFGSLTVRLAAHTHHMRALERVVELKGLDPQTGLPHRANFLDRLDTLLGMVSVHQEGLKLHLLSISGIGRYSVAHGLEETQALLRSIATQLLNFTTDYWELGHISYGVFAIACANNQQESLNRCLTFLKKGLMEWSSLGRAVEQANFIFHESEVSFPEDGNQPEDLLEKALTRLVQTS